MERLQVVRKQQSRVSAASDTCHATDFDGCTLIAVAVLLIWRLLVSVASASFPEQRCRLIVQRLLPVLLLALLVVISPVPVTAAPSDVARFLFPKTVLLTMSDSHGRPLSIGSGLILKPGLVVTNFHVIEGAG
jgi:S1-C subfamily serine protease